MSSNGGRSRSRSKPKDDRRVYVTGFNQKETEEEIKRSFKQFGSIEDFSWKGRFCFIVIVLSLPRRTPNLKRLKKP